MKRNKNIPGQCKGSVTLFASMTIMLVAQVVFLLLEGVRYDLEKTMSTIQSKAAVESVMAQYCKPLWEEYHLLSYDIGNSQGDVDLTQIENEFIYCSKEAEGRSLLNGKLLGTEVDKYTVLTDNDCQAYIAMVGSYMKENFAYEEAKLLYSYYKSLKEVKEGDSYQDEYIDDAIDALKEKEEGENSNGENSSRTPHSVKASIVKSKKEDKKVDRKQDNKEEKKEDNPLEDVNKTRASGTLALVLGKDEKISNKKIHEDPVSQRTLNSGLNSSSYETSWVDKVLLCQYVSTYMSCYTNPKSHHLDYEMEYLLGGKDSDEDNLKKVVNELLIIREAANMLHIVSSATKRAEAAALATAIAGISVNPAIIKAVEIGLMAAWAYCESIMDLRTLLQGGRVPMIKSEETWTCGIKGISQSLAGKGKAKESKLGLNYMEYMAVLLMFSGEKRIATRSMDLQEATVRDSEGYQNVRMDNMACSISVEAEFQYNTIFGSFVSLIKGPGKSAKKKVKAEYAYIK